jgi:hypothetical protein
LFSYLALGTPVTFCCWICGNGSGGAEFSLRAEISTVAGTVQNNLIEKSVVKHGKKLISFFLTLHSALLLLAVVDFAAMGVVVPNSA